MIRALYATARDEMSGTTRGRTAGVALHAGAVTHQGEISTGAATVALEALQPRFRRPCRAPVARPRDGRSAQCRLQTRNLGAHRVEGGLHPGADFRQVQLAAGLDIIAGRE